MRVKVIESFSTAKGNIPTGAVIDIPGNMLESLRGKVEQLPFNSSHWQEEIKRLASGISGKDPGGDCWLWIKENRPDLWKAYLAADMAIDKAFQEQNAEKIGGAIKKARAIFNSLIEAWNSRHNYKQSSLKAV